MEKTIIQIIQQTSVLMTQPQSLPEDSHRKVLVAKFGQRDHFLLRFNPDYQRIVCRNIDVCFFGDYPTLAEINRVYGEETAFAWLVPQLTNLSEYCGCKEKLQGKKLENCADVIAIEYYYLKVSELMLFFHRFKSGRYGRFYGSVDPLVITTSLREFIKERAVAYERPDQEERERKERESQKKAVTWDEYCMREYGEVRPHPFNTLKGGDI